MAKTLTLISIVLLATAVTTRAKDADELEELSMIYEVNETDGDSEVVIVAQAEEGLAHFVVRAPGGKVVRVASHDQRRGRDPLGLAEILLESAEPSEAAVKAAWPEGTYTVEGRTVSGTRVAGEVTLSHAVLPAPTFSPADGAEVAPTDLVITWQPVAGAAFYIVEIENDDLDVNLTAKLEATQTSLAVPNGFLRPGTEYELGLATGTPAGNVAFAEGAFTTTEP
jgi:hypothetical protein